MSNREQIREALEDAYQHFMGMRQMATGPLTLAAANMSIDRNRDALALLDAEAPVPKPFTEAEIMEHVTAFRTLSVALGYRGLNLDDRVKGFSMGMRGANSHFAKAPVPVERMGEVLGVPSAAELSEELGDAVQSDGPRSPLQSSEDGRISAAIAIAPTHKPYRVALEGRGVLARWKVYGPTKEVGQGHFMRRRDAENYASDANAIHAYAIKIALEISKTTNR